jgi:hypothetical protein
MDWLWIYWDTIGYFTFFYLGLVASVSRGSFILFGRVFFFDSGCGAERKKPAFCVVTLGGMTACLSLSHGTWGGACLGSMNDGDYFRWREKAGRKTGYRSWRSMKCIAGLVLGVWLGVSISSLVVSFSLARDAMLNRRSSLFAWWL